MRCAYGRAHYVCAHDGFCSLARSRSLCNLQPQAIDIADCVLALVVAYVADRITEIAMEKALIAFPRVTNSRLSQRSNLLVERKLYKITAYSTFFFIPTSDLHPAIMTITG